MFAFATGCRGAAGDHLARGDQLLASEKADEALAEYQVALRRRGDEPQVLLRLAHGYAHVDRLDEATQYYSRLLAIDSSHADQAISDFLQMGQRAWERGDRAGLARALEQLERIRPGAMPDELALPFGRYYHELGQYEEALQLYLTAHAAADSAPPEVSYDLGRVYDELDDCSHALSHYLDYLDARPRGSLATDAKWHAGRCAYALAQRDKSQGRPWQAIQRLELLIQQRAPQALLDDAYFERGELLFSLGQFNEAIESFQHVLDLNPARTGRLVRSAEDRIRAIRYRSEP